MLLLLISKDTEKQNGILQVHNLLKAGRERQVGGRGGGGGGVQRKQRGFCPLIINLLFNLNKLNDSIFACKVSIMYVMPVLRLSVKRCCPAKFFHTTQCTTQRNTTPTQRNTTPTQRKMLSSPPRRNLSGSSKTQPGIKQHIKIHV